MKLPALQNHFNRYLQVGGFPKLAFSENDLQRKMAIRARNN